MSDEQTKPILIATPEKLRVMLRAVWEETGIQVVEADSYEHALEIVRTQELQGIVAMLSWIWSKEDHAKELFTIVQDKIPTVTLIDDWSTTQWIFEIYTGVFHEYRHYPIAKDELIHFTKRMFTLKNSGDLPK